VKSQEPRFIADVNVGRLAKWLRILGYDTLFQRDLDDDELIRIAVREGRVLLTKDTRILRRGLAFTGRLNVVLVRSGKVREQLRQVVQLLDLKITNPFSRCPECNQPLVPRERDEVQGLVPPYVFQTQAHYMQCPACQRIYWRGTHWQRMRKELQSLGN